MLLAAGLVGCSGRVERTGDAWLNRTQQDPALSGDGRLLAMVSDLGGRPTVVLRTDNGTTQPIPQLRRHQPHSSPSLSWNGLSTRSGRRQASKLPRQKADYQAIPVFANAGRRHWPG